MARYSEAQNKAAQKYLKENYDVVSFRVPKGIREKYNEYAKSKGLSLTQLLVKLIEDDMEKGDADNEK